MMAKKEDLQMPPNEKSWGGFNAFPISTVSKNFFLISYCVLSLLDLN